MSHFAVGVITKNGTEDEVTRLLAPFHEFECTGIADEYVIEVDKTEDARASYESDTTRRLVDPSGLLHDPYDPQFSRKPTEEEKQGWSPFDKMTRTSVRFVPEGWEERQVPTKDMEHFSDWAADWYGIRTVVEGNAPDLDDAHKYGYVLVNAAGEVVKVIDRTNPNKKWDWWVIGGRWDDMIDGNTCLVKDCPPRTPEMGRFFALLTPEGEWIEKGRMGWWACVSDEKEDWPEIEEKVLAKYQDFKVTVVDCHI